LKQFSALSTAWLKRYTARKDACVAGICGNPAFPEMPRQFWKCLEFPQLPRQLQNKASMAFIMTILKIWEKAEH